MDSYHRVVVGTDGSDTSMRAVAKAAAVAADNGAELLVVTAYEPSGRREARAAVDALAQQDFLVGGSGPAGEVLREAEARAHAAGVVPVDTLAVAGPPVEVLDKVVADSGADLLVVGNVGLNSLTGRILGSVPQKLARRAGVDILIVHTS